MRELKRALSSAHNISPGPDGISYESLRHLNEDSLVSLLYLFNRIWREQVYPTQWLEAIVIPILKPGKDPKNPLSYRSIAELPLVRLGGTLSAPFTQAEGVPQGSILSVTLFICHIPHILNIFSPSIQVSLYVDDLQISCEGSDMRTIERQLQTAVNNLVKWCDTNGHSISASKSCCVHFYRKRVFIPTLKYASVILISPYFPTYDSSGCCLTHPGERIEHYCSEYEYIVLSYMDYGCAIYGSACNSVLKKLDPFHHMALRICSGVFRTSPVQSLYVNYNQLPLDLRRRKLSLAQYFKILSAPSHLMKNVYLSTSMKRLYDTRPFMDRMKLLITELDLPNVDIQQRNLLLFQPRNTPRFHYINPFANYSKSTVTPVIFQSVFAFHRSQYSGYSAIYTDGSKRACYVGCGVVIEDIMHGYRLDTSCSFFTAEAVAIYRALQLIDSNMPRIIGNEQADSAARSATTHRPLAVPLSDIKRVILHHIPTIWQESWSQQLDNKLHSVKPVIGAWPVIPMRRTGVKSTRLRIGHTRFTHRHLLLEQRFSNCGPRPPPFKGRDNSTKGERAYRSRKQKIILKKY
ncbi:RNase H domain-containing protein [Trichonephila clavipes]|nr:RNase H domain-containing protein [Trichonephila clavipes]